MKVIYNSILSLTYAYLYIPLAVVIALSFNNAQRSLLWHGFTWKWYQVLFNDPNLLTITAHSLTIATICAIVSTSIALLIAITHYTKKIRGFKLLFANIYLMLLIPDLIIGISLLLCYHFLHLPLGFSSLLISHIAMTLPFTTITLLAATKQLDRKLIHAALDLGADQKTCFIKIIFPLLKSACLVSFLLAFTLSLDDVVISYFTSGPEYEILPLHIYGMIKIGVSPEINALCTLLLIFTLCIVVFSQLIRRGSYENKI